MVESRVLWVDGPFSTEDGEVLACFLGQRDFGIQLEEDQAEIILLVRKYSEERQGEAFTVSVARRPPQNEIARRKMSMLLSGAWVAVHYLVDGNLHIEIK